MKLSAISIAIVLASMAGVAAAAGQNQGKFVMPRITVASAPLSECLPPNDAAGHACDAFNQMVRANFTPREIGELFGYHTSYPESLTGGIDRLQTRYQAVLQQYVAAQQAASGANVAAK